MKNKHFRQATVIFIISAFFYFYDQLLGMSVALMRPDLTKHFHINNGQFGLIAACFHWTYGIMQIPVGLLVDRYGPRALLTLAGISASIGSFLFSSATNYEALIVSRVLMGFGAAFALVGALKLASRWFSPRYFARLTGILVTCGFLGPVIGYRLLGFLLTMFGMKMLMFIAGLIGLGITFLMVTIIRDRPDNHAEDDVPKLKAVELFKNLRVVIFRKESWLVALTGSLIFVPTLSFGGLWAPSFFNEAYGFSAEHSAELTSVIYLGWVFGAPALGTISDLMGSRLKPLWISLIIVPISLCLILYIPIQSNALLSTIMFILGFFSSSVILTFAIFRESFPREIAGTTMGFMNAINTFGGAFMQWFVGYMLDLRIANEYTQISLFDYQVALSLLPLSIILAMILISFVKEKEASEES